MASAVSHRIECGLALEGLTRLLTLRSRDQPHRYRRRAIAEDRLSGGAGGSTADQIDYLRVDVI